MDKVKFTINGEPISLAGWEVSPATSLNDFLRYRLNLRGTKAMCHEGGCGACVVTARALHPIAKEKRTFAVNSCLVPILSCHGWEVTTVEGIGNRRDGYHPIQARLAMFNGTQCGFCTPGWVMSMYSLYEHKSHKLTMKEVENSFAGNMCRCTGYRPILDAFKSLATDVDKPLAHKVTDLEDLALNLCPRAKGRLCKETSKDLGDEWCVITEDHAHEKLEITITDKHRWYKVYTVKDVFRILDQEGYDSYSFVAGNTGQGVYHIESYPRITIDISSVEQLLGSLIDENLVLGAGMTLTDVMDTFLNCSEKEPQFKYLDTFRRHLDLVAHIPVRNCLVPILSCHGWEVTTVEGIGNRRDGYHPIQARLAMFNGTQCGFCTPGWVMSMYSLYEHKSHKLTMKEVENSFAGNMCRCTGYRPILDAFKSLATDVDKPLAHKVTDLEDLALNLCPRAKGRLCKETSKDLGDEWCVITEDHAHEKLEITITDKHRWYKVYTVKDVFRILDQEGYDSYSFVAGNTGQGVYHIESYPRITIDISSVEQLLGSLIDENLVLGAGMTLTDVMDTFLNCSEKEPQFKYLDTFRRHLDLVAHIPVRNIGTLGGNLALKNQHNEFPSDLFLILETVGATVTLVDKKLVNIVLSMKEFLIEDLKGKIILNVKLPPLSVSNLIRTYKIMPRAQNAHAVVNAGFAFKVNSENIVEKATIVYGGIDPKFVHATNTEQAVTGKNLFCNKTLQIALTSLNSELIPDENPPEPGGAFRKTLALGLFYKCILNLCPTDKVDTNLKSGGEVFERPVSRGTQTFDTDKSLWPLNKPVPKLEAAMQCAGEARYANDLPTQPREVYATFVLSTIAVGDINYFDPSEALKDPGVVAFYTAKDIPGKNTFTPSSVPWQEYDEEILCSGKILFYGQPVGIIVATTETLANRAAKLVKVYYKNIKDKKPVLNIRQAIAAPDSERRIKQDQVIEPTEKGEDVTKVFKGSFQMKGQYHYTMEPHTCIVVPCEDHLDVYPSTQWMDHVHVTVANCLNIPENSVNVIVRRVGGAYGGKASRASQAAAACALAAHALQRPTRFVLSLQTNMAAVGKRQDCLCDYEVGVNDEGVIQYLKNTFYNDCGASFNDSSTADTANTMSNLYDTKRWRIVANSVLTDKASNTWCRAPGTTEGTAFTEHIMERIAQATNRDPTEVRMANIAEKNSAVKEMMLSFKTQCEFDSRQQAVNKFNIDNCWKKRAIKLVAMSYPIGYSGNFAVTISVFHADGTVAISHAGIEMGQGINTKAAQVCAHILGIPLEKVSVKPSDSFVTPNAMASNGSITSESVCYAVVKAGTALLNRLQPVRDEMDSPKWEEIVSKAYGKGYDLQSSYMMSELDKLQGYSVYGVTIAEVELDVLTATHQVLRVDILEDTGQSISPDIDVGQIEGAFVMGLGLWTSEQLVYDANTGRLLTDGTWTYKPPGAKDIPLDMRVHFRHNSPNPVGVLRSKATGEPALVMAVVVPHAIHEAVLSARSEFNYPRTEWLQIETPYTLENTMEAISPKFEEFKLKRNK